MMFYGVFIVFLCGFSDKILWGHRNWILVQRAEMSRKDQWQVLCPEGAPWRAFRGRIVLFYVVLCGFYMVFICFDVHKWASWMHLMQRNVIHVHIQWIGCESKWSNMINIDGLNRISEIVIELILSIHWYVSSLKILSYSIWSQVESGTWLTNQPLGNDESMIPSRPSIDISFAPITKRLTWPSRCNQIWEVSVKNWIKRRVTHIKS